jgi:uncharacterized repeat protein (TIGR01451 family)
MKTKLLTGATLSGIAAAVLVATPVFACHPQGYIQKLVQDQTTNSAIVDANSASSALKVNSGDTLVYTIVVSNKGAAAKNGDDDMINTVVTDKLPAGVDFASDATQRTITLNLGTIKPGESATKTIAVTVTSTQDGAVIDNQACYAGKGIDNKTTQNGCDDAVVKVSVPVKPVTPVTPTPTPTPVTPTTPAVQGATTVTSLPNTGSGNVISVALATTVLGYIGSLIVKSKRVLGS